MPEVMGLSGAGVTHSVLPDGSLFTVQLPVERMGWRRLFGVIRNRFSAAGELREAHGLTQVKLRELEAEVRRRERVEAELRAEIEERLQVEARGADLEQELQQARRLESIGLLAGGVAHDFNNLLVAILGNAELLLKRDLDAYGRECVGEISQAAERAAEITGQLLAFGRRQVLQPVPLDVVKVLEDMQGLLRRLLPESVTLDIHAQDQVGAINADRSQVEQVVMNLCVNARDAMPDGGTLAVEIEEVEIGAEYAQAHVWARAGRFVMLRVSDTGVGMSPELLGQIFDPFFTTKPEGSGTGLGLSVVLGVISQHKGFMHPYSELGIGTSMKVYLPLADVDVSPAPPREAPSATRGGDETILVVEDDPLVRSLAGRVLSEAGYSVLTASSGDEGIAVFTERAAQVDLLLLDVVLPGCSGREVHDAAVILRPNVTVLYTSGYSPRGIHTGFVLDEGLELLPKPYAPAELLRRVRCLLDASTAGATVPAS
jgi:signal transduction histidine kinase/CheY-like chemotaxis protein